MASFLWTIFLAYMQQLDAQKLHDDPTASPQFSLFDKLLPQLQADRKTWIINGNEILSKERTSRLNSVILSSADSETQWTFSESLLRKVGLYLFLL